MKRLVTSKINGAVDQGGYLKFMAVFVRFPGEGLGEMYMLSAAYVDGTGGFSAELMVMAVSKIGAEFHFMKVILLAGNRHGFTGHGAKSMVMAFAAFMENSGAASNLMHMLLAVGMIHHRKAPFLFYQSMQKGEKGDKWRPLHLR